MKQAKDSSAKILFRFFSNVLDEWTIETMWANEVDADAGLYKLDNIPFYAPVASDDVVFAEYDDAEQMLTYRETVEYSGNSTVQVVLLDNPADINTIRSTFKKMGCESEGLNDRYFAMEILANKNYEPIKQKLEEMEANGIIAYAEPCLSENHRYQ